MIPVKLYYFLIIKWIITLLIIYRSYQQEWGYCLYHMNDENCYRHRIKSEFPLSINSTDNIQEYLTTLYCTTTNVIARECFTNESKFYVSFFFLNLYHWVITIPLHSLFQRVYILIRLSLLFCYVHWCVSVITTATVKYENSGCEKKMSVGRSIKTAKQEPGWHYF